MFLAESQVETGEVDSATGSLEGILKREGNSNKTLRSEIHKTFADLLVTSSYDNYDHAADELKLAEDGASSDDDAKLEYDRGRLYFVTKKWDAAETAFRNASSLTSDNTFQGEALTALAETLRHKAQYADAKNVFTEVTSKTRYASSQPAAQYEFAYTIDLEARSKAPGNLRSTEFISTYLPPVRAAYFVLDTMYRNISQAVMARSRFRQAELLREIGKYDSAAALANIIIGTKDFSTPEMNNYVNDRMRALTHYAENKTQLVRLDTIENYIRKLRRPGSTMMEAVQKELRQDAIQELLGPKWNPSETYTFTPEEEKKIEEITARLKKQKASSGISVFSLNLNDTARYIDSIYTADARAHFELGRAYEQLDEPDNALIEYRRAMFHRYTYTDTASSQLRAQILFTWVQLDNELKRTDERDSLIGLLIKNFGDTKFAMAAALEYTGSKDKNSPGEVAFRSASTQAKSSFESAKPALLEIVTKYPHEDVAPRALYTIGVYYEDMIRNDSALFYYYRLSKDYPFSRYTDFLKPRITYALQEYDKRKTAQAPLKK
jgi:TolA-binding protein